MIHTKDSSIGSDKFKHKFQCYILKFVYIEPCYSILGPCPSISLKTILDQSTLFWHFGTDKKYFLIGDNVKFSSEMCFCAWSKLKTYFGPDKKQFEVVQNNLDWFEIVLDQ